MAFTIPTDQVTLVSNSLTVHLSTHPEVAGVIRYGRLPLPSGDPAEGGPSSGGDLDLCVVVDRRPAELESIHFHAGVLPVDLNLRTLEDLRGVERGEPLTPIDGAICAGEVLHDRDGGLADRLRALLAAQPEAPPPADHAVAAMRFGQRHAMDKVGTRLDSDPILARLMLESSVYWLLQHYFTVRCLRFPGERLALDHLADHEPAIWQDLQAFYGTADLAARLDIVERLTERVLEPVGGAWKRHEILGFAVPGTPGTAATGRLKDVARQYLGELLGRPVHTPRAAHGPAGGHAMPVEIADYDPDWPERFADLGRALRGTLGPVAVRIDHIGSTSVPGLAAKPIIDVQISVHAFDPLDAYRVPLERLGFVHRADNFERTKRYFREPPGSRRVHVHVRRAGSFSEQFALLFRDYLRTHDEEAAAYAAVKRRLAAAYRDDRHGYTEAKNPQVWGIIRRADEWAQATGWVPPPSDA